MSATRHPELDAMARRVIDANHYMVLGTLDRGGGPRLSPVYYTAARYVDFYWLSSPDAQHSHNLTERPAVEIVIFDSTAYVGEGEAVYLAATARPIRDDELAAVCPEAFRTTAGARRFEPEQLRGDAPLRLSGSSARRRGPTRSSGSDQPISPRPFRPARRSQPLWP